MPNVKGVLPKSNSGMRNSKMSLRGAQRRSNLMKYNEIATPRPLQFLMAGVRNDKKGFGQHALKTCHLFPPFTFFRGIGLAVRRLSCI